MQSGLALFSNLSFQKTFKIVNSFILNIVVFSGGQSIATILVFANHLGLEEFFFKGIVPSDRRYII